MPLPLANSPAWVVGEVVELRPVRPDEVRVGVQQDRGLQRRQAGECVDDEEPAEDLADDGQGQHQPRDRECPLEGRPPGSDMARFAPRGPATGLSLRTSFHGA